MRDKIKEKQVDKIKPTETFMPQINKKSSLMEYRKTGGHQIPRYEILLEMGRMYNLDREQKQLAMLHAEDVVYSNDGDLSEDIRQFAIEKENEQKQFRDAIKELKNNNFNAQDVEYMEDYQTPNNEEYEVKEQDKYE